MDNVSIKILMFDDDAELLELCAFSLGKKGYEVTTETDCNNLVQQVAAVRPDIIFMDHFIGDMGGIAATRRLKEHGVFNSIPIIYFSANNDVAELAREAGADTYFSKPFDMQHLEHIISETLAAKERRNIFLPNTGQKHNLFS